MNNVLLCRDSRLSLFEGGKTGEQTLDSCHLEQNLHALRHAGNRELLTGALAGRKNANNRAEPGRIHIRDTGRVNDQRMMSMMPRRFLEFE